MLRAIRVAVVLAASLILSGCITTALYVANRPKQSILNEMARWCARDAGVRWYGARPEGVELWLPGKFGRDPVGLPGEATSAAYDLFWNNDLGWLRSGVARMLYVNIAPLHERGSLGFGPAKGEASGVYRIELSGPDDPRCGPYRAYEEQMRRWNPAASVNPDRRCVVYTYVGPADVGRHAYEFARFEDEAAAVLGFRRSGEVLLVNGAPRARRTRYSAFNPNGSSEHAGGWGVKACDVRADSLPDTLG
jgi:hypothetical protein